MPGFSKSSTAIALVIAVGIAFAVGFYGWPYFFEAKAEFLLKPSNKEIVTQGQEVYANE